MAPSLNRCCQKTHLASSSSEMLFHALLIAALVIATVHPHLQLAAIPEPLFRN